MKESYKYEVWWSLTVNYYLQRIRLHLYWQNYFSFCRIEMFPLRKYNVLSLILLLSVDASYGQNVQEKYFEQKLDHSGKIPGTWKQVNKMFLRMILLKIYYILHTYLVCNLISPEIFRKWRVFQARRTFVHFIWWGVLWISKSRSSDERFHGPPCKRTRSVYCPAGSEILWKESTNSVSFIFPEVLLWQSHKN